MLNIELPNDPAIPLLHIYSKELKQVLKYLYMYVYNSTSHSSQKVEITQMSVDKPIVIYMYDGMLFSHGKE